MVATPVTPVLSVMHNVGVINYAHQHTHAGKQGVSKSNGCSRPSCSNNRSEMKRKERAVTSARPGTITLVVNGSGVAQPA